jgi:uncharacterized protein (DUF1330 family)
MPAYLVSVVEITNPTPGFKKYAEESAKLLKQFGGKYLARGKATTILSGDLYQKKVLVIAEFPSVDAINSFYNSDAYQKDCKPLREGTGVYDIGIFDAPSQLKPPPVPRPQS